MRNILHRVKQDWLLVTGVVIVGLFAAGDATGLVQTLVGKDPEPGWVVLAAILVIGTTTLMRIGNLREQIDRLEAEVRVEARVGSFALNMPDPGPDKTSFALHVSWDIWTDRDVVATDKLVLNLVYVERWRWWNFWKKTWLPQERIPRKGHGDEYREKISNIMLMPYRGEADFEHVMPRMNDDQRWCLELVLVTGAPHCTYRVPIELADFLHRGSNAPL